MTNELSIEGLQETVGALGEPLRKLTKSDRQRLKKFLKTKEAQALEDEWRLRLSIASGMRCPLRGVDPSKINRALVLGDLVRSLDRLCDRAEEIDAIAPLRSLQKSLSAQNARSVMSGLLRLARGGKPSKRSGMGQPRTVARLEPETGALVLRLTLRAVSLLLNRSPEELTKKERKGRQADVKKAVELTSLVVSQCDSAQVSGMAVEVAALLIRRLGVAEVERLVGIENTRLSSLLERPAQLIPKILSNGCLRDADFLASRVGLAEQAQTRFEEAVKNAIGETKAQIPLASREWAEGLLGYGKAPDVGASRIDSESDVTLERMATLLLAAWEARAEGQKALHMFELFKGICKTGFRLSLIGEPGEVSAFDPTLHEAVATEILSGEKVGVLRPWVRWGEGAVWRVIVRALVARLNE